MKLHTSTANEGANAKIIAPTRNTTEFMTIARRLPIKSTINPTKIRHLNLCEANRQVPCYGETLIGIMNQLILIYFQWPFKTYHLQ